MSLDPTAIDTVFRQGRYVEVVENLKATPQATKVSAAHRLHLAHALYHTGDERAAEAIARRENTLHAMPRTRAQCELVLGLIQRRRGYNQAAIVHFQECFKLARDNGDFSQAAWALVHRFRCFAETGVSNTALAPSLTDMRMWTARAADVHVSAYMHDSIALMEASAGRPEEARRHLRICQSLLNHEPNAWLQQVNIANECFVDFIESRYSSALRRLRVAKTLLPVAGSRHRALLDCNEAHALLASGRFAAAEAKFKHIAGVESGPTALAACDGLARAYLAMDRLDDCASALVKCQAIEENNGALTAAFAGRWTPVTRAKLLLRRGEFSLALRELDDAISRAQTLDDRLLSNHLQCLKVEALAGAGLTSQCADAVSAVTPLSVNETPDYLGVHCRALGVMLYFGRTGGHHEMFARAESVWAQQGNRCAVSELRHLQHSQPSASHRSASMGTMGMANIVTAVSSLGSACRLSYSSSLLGRELINVIDSIGCSPKASIVTLPREAANSRITPDSVELVLGEEGAKTIVLSCVLPKDPLQAMLLGDVLRIGRAALALEKLRIEERDRAAVWSQPPVEAETEALFLAPDMRRLVDDAKRVASTNVPVLITGETGTGKEVLARLVHAHSRRSKGHFLPFNCTATAKETLDSQLFGHRRGSFTGATEHFAGIIRAATGGTLFLDEIGETTLDVQPKLLRFLESSEVHPIGEIHPTRVDVRVIAATNAELDDLVARGRFRDDLFYRLNIVRLHVPPLRERRVEIAALASHYVRRFAQEYQKGDLRLAEETIEYLLLYSWPGNVRQLANEMRRMAALAEQGAVLMPEHLSSGIAATRRTVPATERLLERTEVVVRIDQPVAAAIGHLERAMINHALKECGGRLEDTAARLGLSRKGLYLKRQRYGLESGQEQPPMPLDGRLAT